MNYLLLQHSPCISDVSEYLIKEYPKSSVFYASSLSFPRKPPVLSDKWIVILNLKGNRFLKQLEVAKLSEEFCHFIFISSDNSGKVQELLSTVFSNYSIISNLRLPKETLKDFIYQELSVSSNVADLILSKSKNYEPLLIRNIQTLKLLKGILITPSVVEKYLQDFSHVSFSYLYRYILLGEGDWKSVVSLVYKYSENTDIICKYLIKHLENDIALFKEILSGNLSNDNYVSYANTHNLSIFDLQNVLRLFNFITLEVLYGYLSLFMNLQGSSPYEFLLKGCKKI